MNLNRPTTKLTVFAPDNQERLLIVDPNTEVYRLWCRCAEQVDSPLRLLHARSLAEAGQIQATHASRVVVINERVGREDAINFMCDLRMGDAKLGFCWVGAEHIDDATASSLGVVAQCDPRGGSLVIEGLLSRLSGRSTPALLGAIESLEMFDFLQMRAQSPRTTAIRFSNDQNTGLVVFAKSTIHSAETNTQTGLDALVEITSWRHGQYKEVSAEPLPKANLQGSATDILMRLAQRCDEKDSDSRRLA